MRITRSQTKKKQIEASNKICREWKKYMNTLDPISLEPISKKFNIVRYNKIYSYEARTLCEYIMKSGDYCDPIARIEYDVCELSRLSKLSQKPSNYLHENKNRLLQKRHNDLEHHGLCDVFESEIQEQLLLLREAEDQSFRFFRDECVPTLIQSFENFRTVNSERCKLFLLNLSIQTSRNPLPNIELSIHLVHLFRVLVSHC